MEAITKHGKKGSSTPAGRVVVERIRQMVQEDEPDRYPNPAVFITTDMPGFASALRGNIKRRSPFVIVFPDGRELIATPAKHRAIGAIRRFLARLEGNRKGPVAPDLTPIQLPADYVVEMREPVTSA